MDLERIVGSIIIEGGPKPFVLHTQTGRLEIDAYAEPDEAQAALSVIQQQRFVQLIAERTDVSFAKVRLGQYYDAKSERWVDVLQEGWEEKTGLPSLDHASTEPGLAETIVPKPAASSPAEPVAHDGAEEPADVGEPADAGRLVETSDSSEAVDDAPDPVDAAATLEPKPEAGTVTVEGSNLEGATVIDAVLLPNEQVMLEKAIRIAVEAHSSQFDKGGEPYILHPLRMMLQMQSHTEMMAAVLHDVVEDTAWTLEALQYEGFSDEVVEAVEGLTRRQDESYDAFIERAAQHAVARRVKLADLEDNMDMRRLSGLADKDLIRLARYQKAWHRLKTFGS